MKEKCCYVFLVLTLCFGIVLSQDKKNSNSTYGAVIEANIEANTLFERANNYIESQRYSEAILIFKKLLEQYSNTLIADDSSFYIPFREKVNHLILSLPLNIQLLFYDEIDPTAWGLYKKATEEMNFFLLSEIFQKYYLSSVGDDVALQLGYFSEEKGLFGQAIEYFNKAISHPRCSIDKENAKLNLYFLYSVINNVQKAKAIYDEVDDENLSKKELFHQITKAVENAKAPAVDTTENLSYKNTELKNWAVLWGEKDMQSVKDAVNDGYSQRSNQGVTRINGEIVRDNTPLNKEDYIYQKWKKNLWYPAAQSVLTKDSLIIRKKDRIISYELGGAQKIKWEADLSQENKQNLNDYNYSRTNTNIERIPISKYEIFTFSDQVGKLIGANGKILFAISNHERTGMVSANLNFVWAGMESKQNYEGNLIFALDLKNGKKLWKIGELQNEKDPFYNTVFLHLPLETPNGYYVTYLKKNDVFGAMLSFKREIIWEQYLCTFDISILKVDKFASVYDGESIFLSIGYGFVMRINAVNGSFYWAKKYGIVTANGEHQRYYIPKIKDGAQINSLIYNKGRLVVIPSDSTTIYVLDSSTGSELYQIKDDFSDYRRYLIDYDDTGFYLAGTKGIQKYSFFEQTPVWHADIQNNFGRAILKDDYILFPSAQNVFVVGCKTGKKINMINLQLQYKEEPIGNLAVMDNYLVSTGCDTVYVTNEINSIISQLNTSISSVNSGKQLHKRGMLYAELKEYDKAASDILQALGLPESTAEDTKLYGDSLLDLYQRIEEPINKKKLRMLLLQNTEQFKEENQKMYLIYLQAEDSIASKDYMRALNLLIDIISQSTTNSQERLIADNDYYYSVTMKAILAIHSLLKNKEITEIQILDRVEKQGQLIQDSKFLFLTNIFESELIDKYLWLTYLKKCDNKYTDAKVKTFFLLMQNHKNPMIQLSASYYVFLQYIQLGEYYNAVLQLELLKSKPQNSKIILANGEVELQKVLLPFNIKKEDYDKLLDPSIRQITDPPLAELWDSSKILSYNYYPIPLGGISTRPEFVDRNIYLGNHIESKISCLDSVSGKVLWQLDVPQQPTNTSSPKEEIRFHSNNEESYVFKYRMDSIGLLAVKNDLFAIDLKSGKIVWDKNNVAFEILDFNQGYLIGYQNNYLYVFNGLSGKLLYSIYQKNAVFKAFSYNGKLVVFGGMSVSLSIYNLNTSEEIKSINFKYSINRQVNIFYDNKVLIQNSDNKFSSISLDTGEEIWSLPFKYRLNSSSGIYIMQNKNLVCLVSDSTVFNIDIIKGEIKWSYKIQDRNNYGRTDLCPISGNESIVIYCTERYQQKNKEEKQKDIIDTYLYIDTNTGALQSSVHVYLAENDRWWGRSAIYASFKGDVLPTLAQDTKNRVKIEFYRKRDDAKVTKFSISSQYGYNNQIFVGKGYIFMVSQNSVVVAYGNLDVIKEQESLITKVREMLYAQ